MSAFDHKLSSVTYSLVFTTNCPSIGLSDLELSGTKLVNFLPGIFVFYLVRAFGGFTNKFILQFLK